MLQNVQMDDFVAKYKKVTLLNIVKPMGASDGRADACVLGVRVLWRHATFG